MPDRTIKGLAYRAIQPNWSFDPLSGEGAKRYGGRFNPTGTGALYLALTPLGALAEFNQAGLSHRPQPATLCAYEINVSDIVDLTLLEGRTQAKITLQEMACDFRYLKAKKQLPPTWIMVEFLIKQTKAGVLVPSYAQNTSSNMKNLVLWHWGETPPHQVRIIDDEQRLPKNQKSWC